MFYSSTGAAPFAVTKIRSFKFPDRGITSTLSVIALLALQPAPLLADEEEATLEEVTVFGIRIGSATAQTQDQLPYALQRANAEDLQRSQTLDLSEFMSNRLTSVSVNSAQNNPLQPDVQYRGFTVSPLLGLPQGLAVYQDGVRINEPLGDAVNWDLVPESAIHNIDLVGGTNPVFGLNSLGGALVVSMKNGFNYDDTEIEAYTGSWDRVVVNAQSGGNRMLGNGDEWGYYLNYSYFEEDGWRDLSDSDADNYYATLSWRRSDETALDLSYQYADSKLIGNGALPVGLLEQDRNAIFTAPDITENKLNMFNLELSHQLFSEVRLSGNVFRRRNKTDSFNGDGSEFEACEYAGGEESLFEEADDTEDALDDLLGIDLDAICDGEDPSVTNFAQLEQLIEAEAELAGLDPEDFELEDASDDLTGTGIITDEAINNRSRRKQTSEGVNAQLSFDQDLFSRDNLLIVGFGYLDGKSDFEASLELADLDPRTRSTEGLGVGTFYDEAETDIDTQTETMSVYFTDTLSLTDRLSITLSGRYNDTDITLRDKSGESPELNGDHNFSRFNPAAGFTYAFTDDMTAYGSYGEANRVPTPLELACNEGVFELAREFAIADGEDPDDIDFECRLPNAFLADPPLDDVVTRSYEAGLRGRYENISYQIGVFHSTNNDDIIFQTTGRSTGLFANVDKTRRMGFESAVQWRSGSLDWYVSYSYLEATFEDNFMVLSPNHPNANEDGELAVENGDRIPGLPEHMVKLGGDFEFMPGLSAGMEMIYNSNQVLRGDESNDLDTVDSFTVVNLRASYWITQHLQLFGRVTNVFDEDYENFGLLGEDPDEVLPDLSDDRPLFLGVGAPRGGWIGLRYRL
ncbi:MAG: TonB-dependent receptor [Pseudomonadota bacterium]